MCNSSLNKFIGAYPSSSSAPVPCCHRLEGLVHIELGDLSSKYYPAGRSAPRRQRVDCLYSQVSKFT